MLITNVFSSRIHRNNLIAFFLSINSLHFTVEPANLNFTVTAGKNITLHCPTSKMNDQSIVWWRGKDLITIKNDVRPDLKSYFSYNKESGNLRILEAKISGFYQCGIKFSNQKHRIYITVIEKQKTTSMTPIDDYTFTSTVSTTPGVDDTNQQDKLYVYKFIGEIIVMFTVLLTFCILLRKLMDPTYETTKMSIAK